MSKRTFMHNVKSSILALYIIFSSKVRKHVFTNLFVFFLIRMSTFTLLSFIFMYGTLNRQICNNQRSTLFVILPLGGKQISKLLHALKFPIVQNIKCNYVFTILPYLRKLIQFKKGLLPQVTFSKKMSEEEKHYLIKSFDEWILTFCSLYYVTNDVPMLPRQSQSKSGFKCKSNQSIHRVLKTQTSLIYLFAAYFQLSMLI
jgi:hypothetical protein